MAKIKGSNSREGWISVLIGILISFITAVLMVTTCAIIMTIKDIPSLVVTIASYIILAVSSFLGSWFIGKTNGKNGFQNGAIIGGCCYMLLFILGTIINGIDNTSYLSLLKCICCIWGGIIGGVLGVNAAGKRKVKF